MDQITTTYSKNKYSKYAVICILLSTIIQAMFGYARQASPFWKLIIALLCWASVWLCINKISIIKYYPKIFKRLIISIITVILISFLNSLLFGSVLKGEKTIVLLSNMYTTLDIIGVFFIAALTCIDDYKWLIKATKCMIPISIILLFINYEVAIESYFLTYIAMYSSIFIFYLRNTERLWLVIGYALALFAFFGGGRQAALILVFTILSIIVPIFLNKKWSFYISILILASTLFLMYYSIHYESVFQILSDSYSSSKYDTNDTRTFLWVEFFADFNNQPLLTQLFGKGVVGYYYSGFFDEGMRLGIEVPILQWLMQAGYVYVVLFTIIVIYAIIRLYRYGSNKLAQASSILIAGYYLNCFVSNLIGCNISSLGFWMLIGLSFNSNIIQIKDIELRSFFASYKKKQIACLSNHYNYDKTRIKSY